MPEGVEEVPTIGIIYPPPEVRSILYLTKIITLNLFQVLLFCLPMLKTLLSFMTFISIYLLTFMLYNV